VPEAAVATNRRRRYPAACCGDESAADVPPGCCSDELDRAAGLMQRRIAGRRGRIGQRCPRIDDAVADSPTRWTTVAAGDWRKNAGKESGDEVNASGGRVRLHCGSTR
jgi:hypothetical protein